MNAAFPLPTLDPGDGITEMYCGSFTNKNLHLDTDKALVTFASDNRNDNVENEIGVWIYVYPSGR